MNNQGKYQEIFFDYLRKRKSNEEILNAVIQVLHLGKGAAYKRMNGLTAMTMSELVLLSQHFGVSLDAVFNPNKYVSFKYPFYEENSSSDVMQRFVRFLSLGEEHEGDLVLTYLANELPVFYYFSYEHLFNFLLSIWGYSHRSEQQLSIVEGGEITDEIRHLQSMVSAYYSEYAHVEIWNSNMFTKLFEQIIFAVKVKGFEHGDAVYAVLRDLEQLIQDLRHAVEGKSEKRTPKIYHNTYSLYLNLVLSKSKYIKSTFIGYEMPRFMVSYNEHFFNATEEWIARIIDRSIPISSEGYQSRVAFFSKIEEDYQKFKTHLEKLIALHY